MDWIEILLTALECDLPASPFLFDASKSRPQKGHKGFRLVHGLVLLQLNECERSGAESISRDLEETESSKNTE